jgi:hypothetical protein
LEGFKYSDKLFYITSNGIKKFENKKIKMSEHKICPVCKQYHDKFVSLNSINDRLHGITISIDGRYIDKICYNCREKAEKELKKRGSASLSGDGFEILIFGYIKYLNEIKKYLHLSKSVLDQAVNFIKHQYLAWETHIDNEDKMKYYFASIIMLFREREMHDEEEQLISFIQEHHTNVNMNDFNDIMEEIRKWCQDRGNYNPFN